VPGRAGCPMLASAVFAPGTMAAAPQQMCQVYAPSIPVAGRPLTTPMPVQSAANPMYTQVVGSQEAPMPFPAAGVVAPEVPRQSSVASKPLAKVDELLSMAQSVIARDSSVSDPRNEAYSSWLGLLESRGVFRGLPVDKSGLLRVGAPFCYDFFEAPRLLPFLMERLAVAAPSASGVAVFGSDLQPSGTWWPIWEAWTRHVYGDRRVTLELRQQDLEKEHLPQSGLILGLHPEVTKGGPWHTIIRNILRSRAVGGRAVFANFYEFEAEETAKVCRSCGAVCEIVENPYYAGKPPNEMGTYLRYAVIVAPTGFAAAPVPTPGALPGAAVATAVPAAVAVAVPFAAAARPSAAAVGVPALAGISIPATVVGVVGPVVGAAAVGGQPAMSGTLTATTGWVVQRAAVPSVGVRY